MTKQEKDRIQNAIRHIQTAVDVDPWAVEIAVEAMMKQIPKKVRIGHHPKYGRATFCPNCNRMDVECWSYCPNCGQAIDWSE